MKTYLKMISKIVYLLIPYMIWIPTVVKAHPDGATPYWYPSSYIWGFVTGCAESVELNQAPFTKELWPVQVKNVCGCVLDAMRHSLPWPEINPDTIESNAVIETIVQGTLPVCVSEELQRGKKS